MNSTTGVLSGTTSIAGWTEPIIFHVTDSSGANVDSFPTTLTVISGLGLVTGIDYTDGTSFNYLGYVSAGTVDSISPRTNYSFYVVATGVVTTSVATLQANITVNSNFTATVISITNGVALIQLSGPFSSGIAGDNSFSISVVDGTVSASSSFKWYVYSESTLRLSTTNSFPQRLLLN